MKNKYVKIILAIIMIIIIIAIVWYILDRISFWNKKCDCSAGLESEYMKLNNKMQYMKILPEEAKKMIDSSEKITILDVRTEGEYNEGHIPNSILIPLDTLSQSVEGKIADKSETIFVYCRSGVRSENAAKLLASIGYSNVYDLGGIIDWPYEIEK